MMCTRGVLSRCHTYNTSWTTARSCLYLLFDTSVGKQMMVLFQQPCMEVEIYHELVIQRITIQHVNATNSFRLFESGNNIIITNTPTFCLVYRKTGNSKEEGQSRLGCAQFSMICNFVHKCKTFYSFSAICRRKSVRLSVTSVRPTQAIKIFGNVSMPFDTLAIH